MMKLRITTFLFILSALAQNAKSDPQYRYQGCAVVNLACFSNPVALNSGQLTHDACSQACQGSNYAALFPNACRCGNDSSAVVPMKDSACDYPCMGNPSLGMCGSNCPGSSPNITNIVALPIEKDIPAPVGSPEDPGPSATTISSIQILTLPIPEGSDPSTWARVPTSSHSHHATTASPSGHDAPRPSPSINSAPSDPSFPIPTPVRPNGRPGSVPWVTPTQIPTSMASTCGTILGLILLVIGLVI